MRFRTATALGALFAGLVAGGHVMAQGAGEGEETAPFGNLDLAAGIEAGIGYDDNVYATRNDRIADGLWLFSPEASLSRDGETFDLKLYGEAEIGRYWDETSEDYEDFELGLAASLDLGAGQEIFGGVSHAWEHEDRSSADAASGVEPQRYTSLRSHLGYGATFNGVEIRAGGTFERLDFSDVDAIPVDIDGDPRTRNLYTAGIRLGRDIGGNWQLFGQGYGDFRRYDEELAAGGRDRDSEGATGAVGLRYRAGQQLDFEVLAGVLYQAFDDPGFGHVLTPDIGARLDWRAGPRTRVVAHLDRGLEETTAPASPGIVSTSGGVTVSHLLRRDLSLYAGLDVIHDDYLEDDRGELTFLADAGLRKYLGPHLYVDAKYRYARRDSTLSAFDYDNNQVFLSFGAQLDPRYPEGAAAGFPAPDLEGFYGGIQLPLGALNTEMFGPRGNNGTLTSDFGDYGFGAGVFGGYGVSFSDWYLGIELDGEWSAADWDHKRRPNGRVFSVRKEWSLGAGPIAGYRLERGALVYGRLGVVGTRFDSDYATSSGSEFDETDTLLGIRYGGGMEVPTGGGAFLRMDYAYTAYSDYDMEPPPGDDNFANTESVVRLGLGYRFGAADTDEEPALPAYMPGGFYVGGQGGTNSLFSRITGARSNMFGNSELDAEFGDEGLNGGLFAGWGHGLGPVYVGVEVEVEGGTTQHDHERLDEGRTWSVDKQWAAGASLRLGYVLGPAGMAYLRGGPVWAEFETDYERGMNSVSETDGQLGWRLGVGLETPLDDNLFLRLDYSYTDYEDYDVVYTPMGDSDRFENSESLFRAGVGWRF